MQDLIEGWHVVYSKALILEPIIEHYYLFQGINFGPLLNKGEIYGIPVIYVRI